MMPSPPRSLGKALLNRPIAQVGEILGMFIWAFGLIFLLKPLVEDDPILTMALIWCINVLMMIWVWLGLKLRGQSWQHFGLSFQLPEWKKAGQYFAWSILVFVAAVGAFVLGAIVMANIVGMPEEADMAGFEYLQGNLPILLVSLAGVFIVSSFGEELVYRAFLITRLSELGGESKWVLRSAIVISAIVFGLAHFSWGLSGMVQTACMGFVLGLSYVGLKRRLWINILAHVYMDAILLIQMYASGG